MDETDLVDLLNEDLSLAYRAQLQTISNLTAAYSNGLDDVRRKRLTRLPKQVELIQLLAEQVTTLGGMPTTLVSPPHCSSNVRAALTEEMALERLQSTRLRARARQAEKLGKSRVAGAIKTIAQECEAQVNELESALLH